MFYQVRARHLILEHILREWYEFVELWPLQHNDQQWSHTIHLPMIHHIEMFLINVEFKKNDHYKMTIGKITFIWKIFPQRTYPYISLPRKSSKSSFTATNDSSLGNISARCTETTSRVILDWAKMQRRASYLILYVNNIHSSLHRNWAF